MQGLVIDPWHRTSGLPIDIDSHRIPARSERDEPEHWHHDIRYVVRAEEGAALRPDLREVHGAEWRELSGSGSHRAASPAEYAQARPRAPLTNCQGHAYILLRHSLKEACHERSGTPGHQRYLPTPGAGGEPAARSGGRALHRREAAPAALCALCPGAGGLRSGAGARQSPGRERAPARRTRSCQPPAASRRLPVQHLRGGASRPPGPAYNTPPARQASPWGQPQPIRSSITARPKAA